jgi:hypothetical protein
MPCAIRKVWAALRCARDTPGGREYWPQAENVITGL